jgi:hypothetical protein
MPTRTKGSLYSNRSKISKSGTEKILKRTWSNWLSGRTRRLPRAFTTPEYNQSVVDQVRNKKRMNNAKMLGVTIEFAKSKLRRKKMPKSSFRQPNSVTPMLKWRNNETDQALEDVRNIPVLPGFNEGAIRMHDMPRGTLRTYGPRLGSTKNTLRQRPVVARPGTMSNETRRRLKNALEQANRSYAYNQYKSITPNSHTMTNETRRRINNAIQKRSTYRTLPQSTFRPTYQSAPVWQELQKLPTTQRVG